MSVSMYICSWVSVSVYINVSFWLYLCIFCLRSYFVIVYVYMCVCGQYVSCLFICDNVCMWLCVYVFICLICILVYFVCVWVS